MSHEKRRVGVEVQVMFGTEKKKKKKILLELIDSDERILKHPPATVEIMELKNSTVELRIYFWVVQVQYDWIYTRSDLMLEIDRVFKENDITMPEPEP